MTSYKKWPRQRLLNTIIGVLLAKKDILAMNSLETKFYVTWCPFYNGPSLWGDPQLRSQSEHC